MIKLQNNNHTIKHEHDYLGNTQIRLQQESFFELIFKRLISRGIRCCGYFYVYIFFYQDIQCVRSNNSRSITEQFILIGTMNMFLRCVFLSTGMEYSMNWNNKMNEQMVYAGLTDLQPKQVPQWAQAENLERIRPLRELWKLSENNDTRK